MSETDPWRIFRLPLSTLSKTTLLSSPSLPLFDPVISFPTQSTELSLYSIGSQALGFPAGWWRAGVLNIGNKVVGYTSKLCATMTKILNRYNLDKGFLLTRVLILSACSVDPTAFGLSGGKAL